MDIRRAPWRGFSYMCMRMRIVDLQRTVDEIARLLGAPATIEDRAFQLLAYCAQSGAIDRVLAS